MKYLVDVNALVAWHHKGHTSHDAFHAWNAKNESGALCTCAIVELGFLRISMHVFNYTLEMAVTALESMKKKKMGYLGTLPPPALAAWASTAAKTTDAYLCQLATAHKLQLATFDTRIKDTAAFLIS